MPNHPQAEIAIIGGSGLYEIQGFEETAVVEIDTPLRQAQRRHHRRRTAGRAGGVPAAARSRPPRQPD